MYRRALCRAAASKYRIVPSAAIGSASGLATLEPW